MRGRARAVYAVQFHPEKSSDARAAAAAQLRPICAARRARGRHDRSSRRSTSSAARPCASRRATSTHVTVYNDDPVDAAQRWVDAGAEWIHVVDLDGARDGRAGQPRARRAHRRASRRPGPGRAAASARSRRSARSSAPGAERMVLGTDRVTDPDFVDEAGRAVRRARSSPASTRATAWSPSRAGAQDDRVARRRRRRELRDLGVRRLVYTEHRPRRHADRPDTRRRYARVAERGRLPGHHSRRRRRRSTTSRALAGARPARSRASSPAGRSTRARSRSPRRIAALAEEARDAMLMKRVIPCLDVHEGRVVKGVNFVNLRDAGDPVELAALYDKEGADEVVFLDITATHEERADDARGRARAPPRKVFIPYTVGGGMRSAEDIRPMLDAGADKISLNSAAVRDPALITRQPHLRRAVHRRRDRRAAACRTARPAGRSSSTAAASTPASTRSSGRARRRALGAGEILLTSMDCDGTKDGYDIPLTRAVTGRGQHPGDRQRRRRQARALRRGGRRGRRRRGARRVDLPLRAVHGARGQGAHAAPRASPVRL